MSVLENMSEWGIVPSTGFTKKDAEVIEKINGISFESELRPYAYYINESISRYSTLTAVHAENRSYTYSEFFSRVRCVCEYISGFANKNSRIAVLMGKGFDQLTAAVSVVLAGCVYAPLDSEFTDESALYCLEKLDPACVIADDSWCERLNNSGYKLIRISDAVQTGKSDFDFVETDMDSPMCIIHTSGSTGFPKSVELKQHGLINCLVYTDHIFNADSSDCALALTNHCHDMSLFDIFGMFMCGGSVAVIEHCHWKDPSWWSATIEKAGVTIWNSVPSFMEAYLETMPEEAENSIKQLRTLIHGGDYFKPETAKKIYGINPDCKMFNSGGPTETTLWNIYHEITPEDIENGMIPYGRPFPDTNYYILNENMELLPVGETGEMYVSGCGVSSGYIGGEKRDKFFRSESGEMLYNTGDTGFYSENGYIIFKGRIDSQIKRFGKRIELDGIKACALKCSSISDAAVAAYGENNKNICLFYSAAGKPEEQEIRRQLSEYLPDYMMPNEYVCVEKIPYTNNGKADIKKLMRMKDLPESKACVSEKVIGICEECLGASGIKAEDNFFTLGGNSYKAIKFISALKKEFSCPIGLKHIFMYPTVSELSGYIEENMKSVSETENNSAFDYDRKYELTFVQQIMYIAEFVSAQNNITAYIKLKNQPDPGLFKKAVKTAAESFESLNFIFGMDENGSPYQMLNKSGMDFEACWIECVSEDVMGEISRLAAEKLSVNDGVTCQFELIRDAENGEYYFAFALNHLTADEHSFGIFLDKVIKNYDSLKKDGSCESSAMPESYRKYLAGYSENQNCTDSAYWDGIFKEKGCPEAFSLPGSDLASKDLSGETIMFDEEPELIESLNDICGKNNTSVFTGFLAVLAVMEKKLTGNSWTAVITPATDRIKYNCGDVFGMFLDDMLVTAEIDDGDSFESVVEKMKNSYISSYESGSSAMIKSLRKNKLEKEYFNRRLNYVFLDFVETEKYMIQSESLAIDEMQYYRKENWSERNMSIYIHRTAEGYRFAVGYKNRLTEDVSSVIKAFKETLAECVNGRTADPEAAENDIYGELKEKVKSAWLEVLECDEIDENINFFDAGGFSMLLYKLEAAIEKRVERKIPFMKLMEYTTIESFTGFLAEYLQNEVE